MTHDQAIKLIETALGEPPSSLNESTELRSLESWDSMGSLEVLAAFDAQDGTLVEVDRLADCHTVGDLVALVAE